MDRVEERATAIVQHATEEMYDAMQKPLHEGGLVPVDTGALRASLVFYINNVPITVGDYKHRLAIPRIKLGDTIFTHRVGIDYAEKQEYGFYMEDGSWFHGRFYTTQAAEGWVNTYIPSAVQTSVQGRLL